MEAILFVFMLILVILAIVLLSRYIRLPTRISWEDWEAMQRSREKKESVWREALKHPQWEIRRQTVYDLMRELLDGERNNRDPYQIIKLLVRALRDSDEHVRDASAAVLAQAIDTSIPLGRSGFAPILERSAFVPITDSSLKPLLLRSFLKAAEDQHAIIRKEAVIALGKFNDVRVIQPLLKALGDNDEHVRQYAIAGLEHLEKLVHTLIFARGRHSNSSLIFGSVRRSNSSRLMHFVRNSDLSRFSLPFRQLTQIGIDAETCDLHQIETLVTYLSSYLDAQYLQTSIAVYISGDLTKFSAHVFDVFTMCKKVDVSITRVIFGMVPSKTPHSQITLYDPNVIALTIPLPHLEQVIIHTEHYDFHQVEQFLTYAVSYIGQKYLKRKVEVHLYGDPEKLHLNLRNNLANLCKRVHVHQGDDPSF